MEDFARGVQEQFEEVNKVFDIIHDSMEVSDQIISALLQKIMELENRINALENNKFKVFSKGNKMIN